MKLTLPFLTTLLLALLVGPNWRINVVHRIGDMLVRRSAILCLLLALLVTPAGATDAPNFVMIFAGDKY